MQSNTLTEVAPAKQDLTSQEREQARRVVEAAHQGLVDATRGLSEAQWQFKPEPDSWSIAENLEHAVIVQELVLGPMWAQFAEAPGADPDCQEIDALILSRFPDRTVKVPAPESLHPTGRWTPPVALDLHLKNSARLNAHIESTPGLRQLTRESPPLKALSQGQFVSMDGYQWVLAVAAHSTRHTGQILEVKAHSRFPAA